MYGNIVSFSCAVYIVLLITPHNFCILPFHYNKVTDIRYQFTIHLILISSPGNIRISLSFMKIFLNGKVNLVFFFSQIIGVCDYLPLFIS